MTVAKIVKPPRQTHTECTRSGTRVRFDDSCSRIWSKKTPTIKLLLLATLLGKTLLKVFFTVEISDLRELQNIFDISLCIRTICHLLQSSKVITLINSQIHRVKPIFTDYATAQLASDKHSKLFESNPHSGRLLNLEAQFIIKAMCFKP